MSIQRNPAQCKLRSVLSTRFLVSEEKLVLLCNRANSHFPYTQDFDIKVTFDYLYYYVGSSSRAFELFRNSFKFACFPGEVKETGLFALLKEGNGWPQCRILPYPVITFF